MRKYIRDLIRQKELHLMILPSLIVLLTMKYFPMYGIIIAFKQFSIVKGIWSSPWAKSFGFEHFIDFFKSPFIGPVISNTVIIAILKLSLLSVPPIILAIMFNELRNKFYKKLSQTISYLPHFVSWIVLGGIIYSIFGSNGPVNALLVHSRIITKPYNFLGSTTFFIPLLILSELWKEIGWSTIIYLAIIANIDLHLYEAIEIDGGGRWAKSIHVTWPALKGIFMIFIILGCGNIMSGSGSTFDQCYILGNLMTKDVSEILDTYILKVGLVNARYSFATAVGLIKSFINILLLLGANKISKVVTDKSLF